MKKYRCLSTNYVGFDYGKEYLENEVNLFSNKFVAYYAKIKPEHWQLVEEESTLLKNWHIIVTEENQEIVNLWWRVNRPFDINVDRLCGMCLQKDGRLTKEYNPKKDVDSLEDRWSFGIELTTDQFAQYVLNKEIEKVFIGYECIENNDSPHFTKGKVYQLAPGKTLESYHAFIDDLNINNGWSKENNKHFKPVYKYKIKDMKETKQIIGYRFKKEFHNNEKIIKTACDIEGYMFFGKTTIKTRILHTSDKDQLEKIDLFAELSLLNLWFEPIYENILPELYGYKGEVQQDCIKYGCALFEIEKLKQLVEISELSSNRSIESIKLSSGKIITIEQIKEILNAI